jgi:hypothetical protein
MELEPHESLENYHWADARRDRSGAARYRHGLRDLDQAAGRAGLGDPRSQINLFAAAVGQVGHHLGEGKFIKLGRQTSYTEGFVRDGAGNLAVHATATFSMIGEAPKAK